MTDLVSHTNTSGLHHVSLESSEEGVYVLGFRNWDSAFPEWDYLQDSLDDAKGFCLERWGVPLDSWNPTTVRNI